LDSQTAAFQLAQAAAMLRAAAVVAAEEVLRMVAQTSRRQRGRLKSSGPEDGDEAGGLSAAEGIDEGDEEPEQQHQEVEAQSNEVHLELPGNSTGTEGSTAAVALQASSASQPHASDLQEPAATGPAAGRGGVLMTGTPGRAEEQPDSQAALSSSVTGVQHVEAAAAPAAAAQQPLEGAAVADGHEESVVYVNKELGNGSTWEVSAALRGSGGGEGMHPASAATDGVGTPASNSREESQVNMLIRLAYDNAALKVKQQSVSAAASSTIAGTNSSTSNVQHQHASSSENSKGSGDDRQEASMHSTGQAPIDQQQRDTDSIQHSREQQSSSSFVEMHEGERQPDANTAAVSDSDDRNHMDTVSSDSEESDLSDSSEHPSFVTLTAAQLQHYDAVTARAAAWRPASGNSQAPAQRPPPDRASGPPQGTDPEWEELADWEEEAGGTGQQGTGGAAIHGSTQQAQQAREVAARRSKGRRAMLRTMAEVRSRVEKFQVSMTRGLCRALACWQKPVCPGYHHMMQNCSQSAAGS
jgi:hypothetical protein